MSKNLELLIKYHVIRMETEYHAVIFDSRSTSNYTTFYLPVQLRKPADMYAGEFYEHVKKPRTAGYPYLVLPTGNSVTFKKRD